MGAHETRTFMSGNGVALRLPKGLAIGPNEKMAIEQNGDMFTMCRVPSEADRLARFRIGMAELACLRSIDEVEEHVPFKFPDRPGLY